MSIQLNIIGAVYSDRRWKFRKNMEENTQPQICSVLLYALLCTVYLPPSSFPPNSSIPLHCQARYLHSFAMLSCALKKAHFLPEAIHHLLGPLMTSPSFDSELFSCFHYDTEWFDLILFFSNITREVGLFVRISFEVSRGEKSWAAGQKSIAKTLHFKKLIMKSRLKKKLLCNAYIFI